MLRPYQWLDAGSNTRSSALKTNMFFYAKVYQAKIKKKLYLETIIYSDNKVICNWQNMVNKWYLFVFTWYIRSNLPMRSHLLSSHLYEKTTFLIYSDNKVICNWQNMVNKWYLFEFTWYIRSNLPMRSHLLSSHLYEKTTFFLSYHRKFHIFHVN
jgi:hypothetical protein